ncbi:ZIP family metal transporter [Halorutilales archaeon Cl-col2-1]
MRSRLGYIGLVSLVALSALGAASGMWKLIGISWVAFGIMVVGGFISERSDTTHPMNLVWGYGLSGGAMVTSASIFLVSSAINHDPVYGGIGIASGIIGGYAGHNIRHRLAHVDLPVERTTAEISVHSVSAGVIIGIVYGNMPSLGPLLGLSIVSHKGPAGYAVAHRLREADLPISALMLPASGVGIAGIISGFLSLPNIPEVNGLVFGFASGIFLHAAMDFLPPCETEGEIYEVAAARGKGHEYLDKLRDHALISTVIGGVVVLLARLVLGMG